MVPYGQAAHSGDRREQIYQREQSLPVLSWSPDHERHVTFRSQRSCNPIYYELKLKMLGMWRPSVKFTRWSLQEALH